MEISIRTEPFIITDHMWEVMDPLRPGSERDQGVTTKETRLFMEIVHGGDFMAGSSGRALGTI